MHTNPEVLALLALGDEAGTAAERAHIDSCPACSEEVAELARIADVGRSSVRSESLLTPSPEVWDRIRGELGFAAPGTVLTGGRAPQIDAPAPLADTAGASVSDLSRRRDVTSVGDSGRRMRPSRRFLALAVAAALALIVGIGVGIGYERHVLSPQNRVIASARLRAFPKWPGVTGTAEVTADGRGGRRLLLHLDSPTPINGSLQVWLMKGPKDSNPFWMGDMNSGGTATLAIPPGMSLFVRQFVDVSDEPAGDRDRVHSGDSVARGQLT